MLLVAHPDFVRSQVDEVPHLTLHGLKNQLAERGIIVSHDTVWRFLRREGLSFKKRAAGDWAASGRRCAAAAQMVPLRDWGPKDQRLKKWTATAVR